MSGYEPLSNLHETVGEDGKVTAYEGAGLRGHSNGDMFLIVCADPSALERVLARFGWSPNIDWARVKRCCVAPGDLETPLSPPKRVKRYHPLEGDAL